MKRQMAITAAGLLLSLAPALGETHVSPNETLQGPAQVEAPSESPTTASASPTSTGASSGTNDLKMHFISRQMPDELLVTDVLGRPAVNATDETIGDVNDLVTDKSGKAIAAVIGVGGFLGIGEKDVAIPFEDMKFTRDENNEVRIEVDIDKEALTAAPDYQSLDDQEIVEGANKSGHDDKTHAY